jgi:hypothetical protein
MATDRSASNRAAALQLHALRDPRVTSAPGRAAAWERFLRLVDPDGTLPEAERVKRAERLRQAHMIRMGIASQKARLERKRTAASPNTAAQEVRRGDGDSSSS